MQPAGTTSNGTTSFEVETDFAAADPRVARSSQPWAGGRNPFGIVGGLRRADIAPQGCVIYPLILGLPELEEDDGGDNR